MTSEQVAVITERIDNLIRNIERAQTDSRHAEKERKESMRAFQSDVRKAIEDHERRISHAEKRWAVLLAFIGVASFLITAGPALIDRLK